MATLLYAEQLGQAVSEESLRALTAARRVGGEVDILMVGNASAAAAHAAAALGVRRVLVADAPGLDCQLAEPLTALLLSLADGYDVLMAAATASGRDVMPRLAALLDVMQVSEVLEIVSADTFKRMTYAGSVVQTVQSSDSRKVLTIRASAFPPAEAEGQRAPIDNVAVPGTVSTSSRFVSAEYSASEQQPLVSAKVVVSGGRAFGSAANFERLLKPLAAKLGAAIGASRAAVDAGYAPNDMQVGQTGKVVAPDLYLAVGISGAIQHLAGMKASRVIVAINKDEKAPIFAIADYGLVADLFEALPELDRLL